MPVLTVLPNPLDPTIRERVLVDDGTPLSQAIEKVAKGRPAKAWVNGQESVDQVLYDGDTVLVVVVPEDPVVIAATLVDVFGIFSAEAISATIFFSELAVALAINAVANLLLQKKPSNTSANKTPDPSPTYSIGSPSNAMRLGATIPVVYGEVVLVADFAAQPVFFFDNDTNDQYMHAIYCLGAGELTVLDILVGDSSTSGLPIGTFTSWVYPPQSHIGKFGLIESATGVQENVTSSMEVSELQLFAENDKALQEKGWYWKVIGTQAHTPYDGVIDAGSEDGLRKTNLAIPLGTRRQIGIGSWEPDWGWDGGGGIGALSIGLMTDPTQHGNYTTWTLYEATDWEASQPAGSVIPEIDPSDPRTPIWCGWFDSCRADQKGDLLQLDFVMPQGLFRANDNGSIGAHPTGVEVLVEYYNVLTPNVIQQFKHRFTGATNTAQRRTLNIPVTLGHYKVRARNLSLSANDTRTGEDLYWTGLKQRITHRVEAGADWPIANDRVYGDVTLVAVRLKAINQVSGSAAQRVRFKVRRELPTMGGLPGLTYEPTNPVEALADILTNRQYGARLAWNDTNIDVADFKAARARFAGTKFSAVFDRTGTVWEACQMALQGVAASPLPWGSRMGISVDCKKANRVAMFSENNIVAGTLSVQYSFDKDNDPNTYVIEYREPVGFEPATVEVGPAIPPDLKIVENVSLFGCTNRFQAIQFGQLMINRKRLERKIVSFETELEGLAVRHGDRIAVSHSLPSWGQSAAVIGVAGRTLTVDKALDWSGTGHAVILRDPEGMPHTVTGVFRGNTASEIVLPSGTPFDVQAFGGDLEPTHVAFGPVTTVVTDWIVTEMVPSDESKVKITAVTYREDVFNNTLPHQQVPL